MRYPDIGFLGFGEAAACIAEGLTIAGNLQITAFDIHPRPNQNGVRITQSIEDMLKSSDIVFSAVTCTVAIDAARQAAPYLTDKKIFVDINSVSPETKITIGKIIENSGALYVEAAIMAAVPSLKHKVPMLLSGKAAGGFIDAMEPHGMKLENLGPDLGRASAIKMFRSIIVKGMEALFQECILGAEHYGVAKKVLDSISDGFSGSNWDQMAHYLIGRTALHGERRAHEMKEVASTLRTIGVEPLMTEAAEKRIQWAAKKGLKDYFSENAPDDYREVMRAIQVFNDKKRE
ncbi:MAG: DUF1932 domain-containing protein [Pseudomonadota bacterium]|nr:DUF1932 domain-containing protein [Pseudomonadota bacterium]